MVHNFRYSDQVLLNDRLSHRPIVVEFALTTLKTEIGLYIISGN